MSFFCSILWVTQYYFSEQNIIFTNKSRSSYSLISSNEKNNLPLLKNDTQNIIIVMNDLENFKKNRKERSWEGLISNKND